MTTRILMGKDITGLPSNPFNEIPFTDYNVNFPLDGTNPITITVPPNMNLVYFSFSQGADVWVSYNSTVGPPTIDSFFLLEDGDELLLEDGDNLLLELIGDVGEVGTLNPFARSLDGITQMSFFSDDACFVNLNFYNRSATGRI